MELVKRIGYFFNLDNIYTGENEVVAPSGYDEVPRPQMATWVKPPEHDSFTHYALYDRPSDSWSIHEKYVEVTAYNKETMRSKQFEDASLVTDEYTLLVPISDKCTWDGLEWVEDVEKWRSFKKHSIRTECGSKIDAGFTANILFDDCNYRNCRDQQDNIRDCALGEGGYIWMNESFIMHTKDQAEQVYAISRSEVQANKLKYANKCAYLNEPSRTVEEIQAVTWDSSE